MIIGNSENYKNFLDYLENHILLCDGAMGTELHAVGVYGCLDAANINNYNRDKVINVHLDYLEAGSDIIQTNTFGANPIKLSSYSLDDRTEDINKNSVSIAKQAIDIYEKKTSSTRKNFIAGDVGPTGKLMEPSGDLKYDDAVEFFSRQMSALIESRVDFLLIETMLDINEALAAVEAARKISGDIPVACTLSYGSSGVTLMGNKAEESGKILLEAGCNIIGANCSIGSDSMLNIAKKLRSTQPDAKLIFQPNAGLPVLKDGNTTYNETPDIMARNISQYLKYSPSILGACCGSAPGHIKKIASLI